MKPAELRAQIAAGRTGPLYLLEGDDLQSRHDLALEFAALVDEATPPDLKRMRGAA